MVVIRKIRILKTFYVASDALTCCFLLSTFPGGSANVYFSSKNEVQHCEVYACFTEEQE